MQNNRRIKVRYLGMAGIISKLSAMLAVLAAVSVLLMMLLTCVDIGLRSLTGRSLAGAQEIIESLMVAVVFLGMAYALQKREHVAISLLTDALPIRLATVLRLAGQLVMNALVVWIIIRTGQAAIWSYSIGEVRFGLLQIPMWPARASIPIGFTGFLLQSLLDIPEHIRAWNSGKSSTSLSTKTNY
jgi:TRAP-type C4-dicarboxylate transport system permease small subunit